MKGIARKIFLMSLALLCISGCDYFFPTILHYKITIEIETPKGIKVGEAVRKVSWMRQPRITPETQQLGQSLKGEAVTVDLGERGAVFSLIASNSYEELYEAIPAKNTNSSSERIQFYRNLKIGTQAELKHHHPKMVTFNDLSDPKSVKLVYRQNWEHENYKTEDHFNEVFGEGVQLKQITIEITDAPVTWKIREWLPWLDDYYNQMLDGNRIQTNKTKNRLANSLSAGSFSTLKKQ